MCNRTTYRYSKCSHVSDPSPTLTNRSAKGQGSHNGGNAQDTRRSRLCWVNLCEQVRDSSNAAAPCPVWESGEVALKGYCPACALLEEGVNTGVQEQHGSLPKAQDDRLKVLLRGPHKIVRVRDGKRTKFVVVAV